MLSENATQDWGQWTQVPSASPTALHWGTKQISSSPCDPDWDSSNTPEKEKICVSMVISTPQPSPNSQTRTGGAWFEDYYFLTTPSQQEGTKLEYLVNLPATL